MVIDDRRDTVYVYHAGFLSRRVESPGGAFREAVRGRALPGKVDEAAWRRLASD